MHDEESEYEVGFCRPPKRTQFKPGVSGNPKGRPKGSKNLATVFRRIGDQKVSVKTPQGVRFITKREAAIIQLMNGAAEGKLKHITEVIRLEQSMPYINEAFNSGPIKITFVDAEDGRPLGLGSSKDGDS